MSGISDGSGDESSGKRGRNNKFDDENGRGHRSRNVKFDDENGKEQREPRNGRKREEPAERRERFNTGARDKFVKDGEKPHRDLRAPAESEAEPAEEPKEREPKAEAAKDREPRPKVQRRAEGKRAKVLSPEQEKYRDMLLELSSTKNAKMLKADNEVAAEVAVKGLHDAIKDGSEGIITVIFDGVVSQRIVDVCGEKGISTVVGTRKGSVSKMPAGITIWTKEDLC